MVVEDDNRCGAASRRFAKHLTRLDDQRVRHTRNDDRRAEHTELRIEQRDPQSLDVARSEPRQQIFCRALRIVDPNALARRRCERAPSKFERRHDLRRVRAADARDARQLVGARARQPVQSTVRREELVGERQRPRSPRSVADDEGNELVVAERHRTKTPQLLARTIIGRKVLHLTRYQLSAVSYQLSAVERPAFGSRVSALRSRSNGVSLSWIRTRRRPAGPQVRLPMRPPSIRLISTTLARIVS